MRYNVTHKCMLADAKNNSNAWTRETKHHKAIRRKFFFLCLKWGIYAAWLPESRGAARSTVGRRCRGIWWAAQKPAQKERSDNTRGTPDDACRERGEQKGGFFGTIDVLSWVSNCVMYIPFFLKKKVRFFFYLLKASTQTSAKLPFFFF
jgi:hypothetical protein